MRMFIFVLDSFKGEIFDFKVKRRVLVASTVNNIIHNDQYKVTVRLSVCLLLTLSPYEMPIIE